MAQKLVQYSYQYKQEKQKKGIKIFVYLFVLFILINVIITFLCFPLQQNSVSMSPDLPEKSLIMATPLSRNYNRGDVVVIKPRKNSDLSFIKKTANLFVRFFTAQKISLSKNQQMQGTFPHIRRVVGLPGDAIYMRDYVLFVKPAGEKHFLTEFEISSKPYNVTFFVPPASWDSSLGLKGSFDEMILGENEYFVLSDNRKSSDDSRLWGTIAKSDMSAKVLMCYFPFEKFHLF